MFARFLIGFSFGYSYLVCIVHASEIMTQKLRGMIVITFNFMMLSSIVVNESIVISTDHEKHALGTMQWIGIYGAFFGIFGMILLPFFTRESPVQLIQRNKENEALSIMIKVRNESTETYSIRNEFNELKTMVEEDKQFSPKIFLDGNERALIMITLIRVGNVLAFNYGLNMIRHVNTEIFKDDDGVNLAGTVFMTIRMMSALITIFTIDNKGRKLHFLISFGGSSVSLIFLGFLIFWYNNVNIIAVTQILIEIFGGIGIGSVADVYSSEAFATSKKSASLFVTISIEFAMQALIIALSYNSEITKVYSAFYLIVSGGLLLLITYYLKKKLPETAQMSIRQSRNEFLKTGEIVFSGGNKSPPTQITFH
jgi:MFS family permease